MPDAAVIERRGKAHAEAAEVEAQADAKAAKTVKVKVEKPKKQILDDRGLQLTFEDVPVEEIHSRLVGDFNLDNEDYFRKNATVRFEGIATLRAVEAKTVRRGKLSVEVRSQKFYVDTVEIWRDEQGLGKPNEIDEKLAAVMAERRRLAGDDA